jgi:hypothetical protein
MRAKFLGTTSQNGTCPTLFATDRGTLLVQGYVVADPEALNDVGAIPEGEAIVEIPAALLSFYTQPMQDGATVEDERNR